MNVSYKFINIHHVICSQSYNSLWIKAYISQLKIIIFQAWIKNFQHVLILLVMDFYEVFFPFSHKILLPKVKKIHEKWNKNSGVNYMIWNLIGKLLLLPFFAIGQLYTFKEVKLHDI